MKVKLIIRFKWIVWKMKTLKSLIVMIEKSTEFGDGH